MELVWNDTSQVSCLCQKPCTSRLIRDGDHLRKVIRYIRRNPVKAHLGEDEYSLWESELAKAVK